MANIYFIFEDACLNNVGPFCPFVCYRSLAKQLNIFLSNLSNITGFYLGFFGSGGIPICVFKISLNVIVY